MVIKPHSKLQKKTDSHLSMTFLDIGFQICLVWLTGNFWVRMQSFEKCENTSENLLYHLGKFAVESRTAMRVPLQDKLAIDNVRGKVLSCMIGTWGFPQMGDPRIIQNPNLVSFNEETKRFGAPVAGNSYLTTDSRKKSCGHHPKDITTAAGVLVQPPPLKRRVNPQKLHATCKIPGDKLSKHLYRFEYFGDSGFGFRFLGQLFQVLNKTFCSGLEHFAKLSLKFPTCMICASSINSAKLNTRLFFFALYVGPCKINIHYQVILDCVQNMLDIEVLTQQLYIRGRWYHLSLDSQCSWHFSGRCHGASLVRAHSSRYGASDVQSISGFGND